MKNAVYIKDNSGIKFLLDADEVTMITYIDPPGVHIRLRNRELIEQINFDNKETAMRLMAEIDAVWKGNQAQS